MPAALPLALRLSPGPAYPPPLAELHSTALALESYSVSAPVKFSRKRPQASTSPSPTPRHAPAASVEGRQARAPGTLARPAAQGVQGWLPEAE